MGGFHEGGSTSKSEMARSLLASKRSRKTLVRFAVLAGLAAATIVPVSAKAQTEAAPAQSLEAAVVEEMGVESNITARNFAEIQNEERTQVNVMRGGEEWAFGSAVIEAPKKRGHYPKGWLFVANESGEGWDVALEGTSEFKDLTSDAPEEVVSNGEKSTFSSQPTANARTLSSTPPLRTGLMLPWRRGGTWKFTGGPHGWATGYDRPYAALDFAGPNANDQRVRAAGGGRVYTMCNSRRGWIRVYHPNGFSTDYYHLIRNIRPAQGARIKIGTVMGLTGNDVSCGGASYGRHVHFALLWNTRHIPVHGRFIGGWKFVQGQAYRGYAQRGQVRRVPGSLMKNFGP
jgi:LasA protease